MTTADGAVLVHDRLRGSSSRGPIFAGLERVEMNAFGGIFGALGEPVWQWFVVVP
jgi:hypothetical protein